MPRLTLKPTHQAVTIYYRQLQQMAALDAEHEGAVAPAFAALLRHCAEQVNLTLHEQYPYACGGRTLYPDGALIAPTQPHPYGFWEAKDTHDDLPQEIRRKFDAGYPDENILFQAPHRAILWQHGAERLDCDLSQPDALVEILTAFFDYQPPENAAWERAVDDFKAHVPKLGERLVALIEEERRRNRSFTDAFNRFMEVCKKNINPNLSVQAVEEMLIQHLLTERIFQRVFDNPDFVNMNIIAHEIEQVVHTMVFPHGGRHVFFQEIDPLYRKIEDAARSIHDFAHKQAFLNTVYERFFQGFSVKVADTHGIVYTPQEVVQFMVNSIEDLLRREFDRSLSDPGVHILDPFVGTGNFIVHVMQRLRKTALHHKYQQELHCNEVMLLPYYIASLNIEHEYRRLMGGEYQPFEGICLVDTFQLEVEKPAQGNFDYMYEKNTARVNEQQGKSIFVILGNPPYNAGQVNENDNNKNRTYERLDQQVADTYANASQATNKNALSDVYVKAIRWASDRIGDEGIVAFISNNSFLDGIAFDGMRKHLSENFSKIYHLDLKGNARTAGKRRKQEAGNVFDDAIRVGVGITFFLKKKDHQGPAEIYLYSVDDYLSSQEKKQFLHDAKDYTSLPFTRITPDKHHNWLTEGLHPEFEDFIPLGTKAAKRAKGQAEGVFFQDYSNGVKTNRDTWVCNFDRQSLADNIQRMIETYNDQVSRWHRRDPRPRIDDFVLDDATKISWSSGLKSALKRAIEIDYNENLVRRSLYRPFTEKYLYFDKYLNERRYQFPHIFPTPATEAENRVICVSGVGSNRPFQALMTSLIPCLDMLEKTQCFPFYTYNEDGRDRRENLTDWALAHVRAHYRDERITKWDLFHYIYALLHHPQYRERYAANLTRDLPRLPLLDATLVNAPPQPGHCERSDAISSPSLCTGRGNTRGWGMKPPPCSRGGAGGEVSSPLPVHGEGAGGEVSSPLPVHGEGAGGEVSSPLPRREGPGEGDLFWAFADAGKRLADLHLHYAQQPLYPLELLESEGEPLDWRVEKMRLS
ncbi:N-6 DNA methylase, partial [candidate division KSB3 bacterium]|nr:N-6 DNA methylase [candidate division KSB3 bacterium]